MVENHIFIFGVNFQSPHLQMNIYFGEGCQSHSRRRKNISKQLGERRSLNDYLQGTDLNVNSQILAWHASELNMGDQLKL